MEHADSGQVIQISTSTSVYGSSFSLASPLPRDVEGYSLTALHGNRITVPIKALT